MSIPISAWVGWGWGVWLNEQMMGGGERKTEWMEG